MKKLITLTVSGLIFSAGALANGPSYGMREQQKEQQEQAEQQTEEFSSQDSQTYRSQTTEEVGKRPEVQYQQENLDAQLQQAQENVKIDEQNIQKAEEKLKEDESQVDVDKATIKKYKAQKQEDEAHVEKLKDQVESKKGKKE